MKILILSDLHYGFSESTHSILENFFKSLPEHDLCLVAGDLISHRQNQWEGILKLLNQYVTNCYFVKGNHDGWVYNDKERLRFTWNKLVEKQQEIWDTYPNIKYLPNNSLISDKVIIVGFDGWYSELYPPSNDKNFMPTRVKSQDDLYMGENVSHYLTKRAHLDLENCLKTTRLYPNFSGKKICVTHHAPYAYRDGSLGMSANPKYFDIIKAHFDILVCGHNHLYRNDEFIKNPGSDYNKPRFILLEIS